MFEAFKDAPNILLTALIVGFLVPTIKGYMDNQYFKKQKEFERSIRIQENMISKKIDFVNGFITKCWEFHFSAIRLTYYASDDKELNSKENKIYQEGAWKAIAEVRQAASPGSYLLPEDRFRGIVIELLNAVIDLDEDLSDACSRDEEGEVIDWEAFHDRVVKFAITITKSNRELAKALEITSDVLIAA